MLMWPDPFQADGWPQHRCGDFTVAPFDQAEETTMIKTTL